MYKRKVIFLFNDFSVYKTDINLYADEIYKDLRNITIIFFFKKCDNTLSIIESRYH